MTRYLKESRRCTSRKTLWCKESQKTSIYPGPLLQVLHLMSDLVYRSGGLPFTEVTFFRENRKSDEPDSCTTDFELVGSNTISSILL